MHFGRPSWGNCAFVLTALLSESLQTLCIHLFSGRLWQAVSYWFYSQRNLVLKKGMVLDPD